MGRVGGGATFPIDVRGELRPGPEPSLPFVVGVVDTGVVTFDEQPHAYLAGRLADGWTDNVDTLQGDGGVSGPEDGHGTFVCGRVLQQAPRVTLDVRNALDGAGDDDGAVAAALRSLIGVPGLKLVNLSFFGESEDEPPRPIGDALGELLASDDDLLVVTAAGNSWTGAPVWPAAFSLDHERLLAVGALDESVVPVPGRWPPRASFSNYGEYVDAWAGGVDVLGPCVSPTGEQSWRRWGGTSFAAAAVTGRIAATMIELDLTAPAAWAHLAETSAQITVEGRRRPYVTTGGPQWVF